MGAFFFITDIYMKIYNILWQINTMVNKHIDIVHVGRDKFVDNLRKKAKGSHQICNDKDNPYGIYILDTIINQLKLMGVLVVLAVLMMTLNLGTSQKKYD